MAKILVTGASGNMGRLTLENLLKRGVPAGDLAALVRDPAKAEDLAARGIQLHRGDYMDPGSLLRALADVEKLMLTPTQAFTDRRVAHANVIDAAVKSGVRHLFYTPILRKPGSDFAMSQVTREDRFTEDAIKASGLNYTFLRHPPYLESLPPHLGPNVLVDGIRVPAGEGKVAAASREDLAEAHGAVLTQTGHENTSYALTGEPAVSFTEMAAMLTRLSGRLVGRIIVSDAEYVASGLKSGLPDFVAKFLLEWVTGFNQGEWDQVTPDLGRLLGRKPLTTETYLAQLIAAGTWA